MTETKENMNQIPSIQENISKIFRVISSNEIYYFTKERLLKMFNTFLDNAHPFDRLVFEIEPIDLAKLIKEGQYHETSLFEASPLDIEKAMEENPT